MQAAIVTAAATGDTDSDTAFAVSAVAATTAGAAIAERFAAVAAAAATGDTDSDTAFASAAIAAAAAGVAVDQHFAAVAAAAATGDTDSDTAVAGAAFSAAIAGVAGVSKMMVAGSIDGNSNWVESTSMARAIEDAMVAAGVIKLEKEAKATTHDRRNSFVAIATGLINYLQASMELHIPANALGPGAGNVPATDKALTQVVK